MMRWAALVGAPAGEVPQDLVDDAGLGDERDGALLRLPHLSIMLIVEVLEALDSLGLGSVKTATSFVTTYRTGDLRQWITGRDWATLMDCGPVC